MPETNRANEAGQPCSKGDEPGIGAQKALRPLIEAPEDAQAPGTASEPPHSGHHADVEEQAKAARSGEELRAEAEQTSASGPTDATPHPAASRPSSPVQTRFGELATMESLHPLAGAEGGEGRSRVDSPLAEEESREGLLSEEDGDTLETETADAVLAGLDSLDEDIQDLSAAEIAEGGKDAPQPFEGEAGQHTLAEIALASSALMPLEGEGGPGANLSSKHDELAEAVQAALLSLYGEAPSASSLKKPSPFSHEAQTAGSGWKSDDHLSPQDVILNYFDYQPATGKRAGRFGDHLAAQDSLDEPFDSSLRQRPHWTGPASSHYDAEPMLSESHAGIGKAARESERESNRLLGAAAIGLISGIAIAASLAVFVINAYGPGSGQSFGALHAPDANQSGYGWIKRGAGQPSPEASASASVAAPVIAVSDLSVTPGQPSPLAIGVKPDRGDDSMLISITGMPDGARLSAGVDAGGGHWLLPPRRLTGLTINVPAATPEAVPLSVQVLDGNLRTPLSEKTQFTLHVNAPQTEPTPQPVASQQAQPAIAELRPVSPEAEPQPQATEPPKPVASFFSTETVPNSAPQGGMARQAALQAPAPAPAPTPSKAASKTEIEDMIRDGNKRMRDGDILEARKLYQKAAAQGDPEAALAMGRAYDPVYFARLDKKNAEPDAAKAFDWYRKALDGGARQTAKLRIENLKHFLNH